MKWFQHDTNALHDAKIEKLIMKFGVEGYGLYFACVEMIAGELSSDNVTFELEHDAEILAYKFKIDTLKVEAIMKYMVSLGLFQHSNESGRIICLSLANRLDNHMARNPEIKKIAESIPRLRSNYEDTTHKRIADKTIVHDSTLDNSTKDKNKYAEFVTMTEKEYNSLIDKHGEDRVKMFVEKLNNYKGSKGKKYKSDYRAILLWVVESVNGKKSTENTELGYTKVKTIEVK